MSKFKVGDVVVLTEDYQGVPEGTILTLTRGEVSFPPSNHGLWWADELLPYGVFGRRLELYSRPIDDELPPAPKSVLYHHQNHMGLDSNTYLTVYTGDFCSGPRIRLQNPSNTFGITIDADTALQLCHDLRRMAMEIKRKEKQNG